MSQYLRPWPTTPTSKAAGRDRWEWDQKRARFLWAKTGSIAGNHPGSLPRSAEKPRWAEKATPFPAAGLVTRILQEGYRWADYGAWDFWMNSTDADGSQYNSFSPWAVLCRQWNFSEGKFDDGAFAIFNDTHTDGFINFKWTFVQNGKTLATDTKRYFVAAGTRQSARVNLHLERWESRQEGDLILTLDSDGKEVFRDTKAISILPFAKAPSALANLKRGGLAVYDNVQTHRDGDSLSLFIAGCSDSACWVDDLGKIPESVSVLLIGRNSITKEMQTSPTLAAWAAAGRAVVVLDQANPLQFQAFPAELQTAKNIGSDCIHRGCGPPHLQWPEEQGFL